MIGARLTSQQEGREEPLHPECARREILDDELLGTVLDQQHIRIAPSAAMKDLLDGGIERFSLQGTQQGVRARNTRIRFGIGTGGQGSPVARNQKTSQPAQTASSVPSSLLSE